MDLYEELRLRKEKSKLVNEDGELVKTGMYINASGEIIPEEELTTTLSKRSNYKVLDYEVPRHPASTGRIYVEKEGLRGEYFPNVCNLKIIEEDHQW